MAKLKRSDLRAHLLRSIQILKVSLTYTAYCSFILTMLFFTFVMESTGEYGGIQQTQLIVSPSIIAPRSFQGKKKQRLQDDLAEAFSDLEYDNPLLKEVLLRALPETPIPDNVLVEYQQQLDRLQQATGVFSNPESFGYAYEYWIEQLALQKIKRGVSFYTPRPLIRLMVELLKPHDGLTIYDPSVGTGGTLVETARYVKQHGGDPTAMRLLGREKALDVWSICQMNMLAQGLPQANIEQGDTLQAASTDSRTFDLVLQAMPLSSNRRSGQLADAAFLRHAVQSLTPDGRAAVLCPASVTQYDHADFWRFVLNRDWLEAVISLPPGLLQGTPAGAYVFIFNKQKAPDRLAHVLFVEAAPDFVSHSRHNQLPDEVIQTVVQSYDHWGSTSRTARIVPIQQIEARNYRLNVEPYLAGEEAPEPINVNLALTHYRTAVQKRDEAIRDLMRALERLSYTTGTAKDENSTL
ncbi:MAG TPA: N-6 DNA methylase [Phototrophicaceae bacterium]|nr:N-6 DNA methylase [Phototrophicaceae bacterium]